MENEKSITAAAHGRATMIATESTSVLIQGACQLLQNFLLIWLDADFNESKEDFRKSILYLRNIVATVKTFTDVDQCIDFLTDLENEKVFMIVSGILGQQLIPEIQVCPQLDSIYVFCENLSLHEQWTNKIPKVQGVYTQIETICEALKIDCKHSDRGMISISFQGIDPLFMYMQLLKETLLEINDDDDKSIKELVDYCRLQGGIAEKDLTKFEQEYRLHTPIWWYTSPYFLFTMLNRALRLMDVDIILKMGFFIRHLHQHIENLHREQQLENTSAAPFQAFRGQRLSIEDFNKLTKTKGGLMSFNNFLSTSRNRDVSLEFYARPVAHHQPNSMGILFVMTIDPAMCAVSSSVFVDAKNVGYIQDQEEEILFSTHTIFRIERIDRIHDNRTDRLWEVNLNLYSKNDHDLNTLTEHIRADLSLISSPGWSRLVSIGLTPDDVWYAQLEIADGTIQHIKDQIQSKINARLTWLTFGNYLTVLKQNIAADKYYQYLLHILPPDHPSLVSIYNNMGLMYTLMNNNEKALECFEKTFEFHAQSSSQAVEQTDSLMSALRSSHDSTNLQLATLNKLAEMSYRLEDYPIALDFYRQAYDMTDDEKLRELYQAKIEFLSCFCRSR
ncbi:unnamed protein product [Rotaria sp. Silwood2]|nr:unnamed protein product [Rotaria sp. Silwood2]